MSEEVEAQDDGDKGAPAWVMTFADLMSLLMCFFVLLLAFSEMDVLKFKQLSGSMKSAFGVQREVEANEIPKGTSIITQEFSPGIPQPTPFQVLQQETTDETKDNLDFSAGEDGEDKNDVATIAEKIYEAAVERTRQEAEKLIHELKDEIDKGNLEVEWAESEITIRLRERSTFNSGEAKLKPTFFNVVNKVASTLNKVNGGIIVAGHTDNLPIRNNEFRSNWELSAARAANVVHYLTTRGKVDPTRIHIRAHADTKPLVPNLSEDQRAKNRRVEIVIAGNEKLFIDLNNEFPLDQINEVTKDIDAENSLSIDENVAETNLEES
jgi:chemotaxis protein MotB